jgi:predicted RNase H-like HicB family nuclease
MDIKVHLQPGESGKIIASAPALPGCRSQGDTRDEALANIREAILAWLETEQDKPSTRGSVADVATVSV